MKPIAHTANPNLIPPACGHAGCAPRVCRFAGTDGALFSMHQGDRRDASNFNLLARVSPKLSARGRLAFYSGVSYQEKIQLSDDELYDQAGAAVRALRAQGLL